MKRRIRSTLAGLLAGSLAGCANLDPPPAAYPEVGLAFELFVDRSRPTPPSPPFEGAGERRLDTWIWYPAEQGAADPVRPTFAAGSPWPLVLYSHGAYGRPNDATHVCEYLARHGYVVAAPAFPLTASSSHARLPAADVTDAGSQPRDLSFLIDSLLAHPRYGRVIDADRIGATGISLGGITTYFASFGVPTRDPRIKASAPIAPGDPAYAALSYGLGFDGVVSAPVRVPALLLVGERDVFAAAAGGNLAAYARLQAPKYMVEVRDAPHLWFGDRDEIPANGVNPDCIWFQENTGEQPSMCARRTRLIDPARQKEIVRYALLAFFDGHLKADERARQRLQAIEDVFDAVTVHRDAPDR